MKLLSVVKTGLRTIKEWLAEKRMGKPTMLEAERIEKLRGDLKNLIGETPTTTDFWAMKRIELYKTVLLHDPRNFTNWPVMYPMFHDADPKEFREMTKASNWKLISEVIREDKIGNPKQYDLFPASSGNLIHHAYSLFKFAAHTGKRVEEMDLIFEFGGGYGSFCRLLYKWGFKGTYVIFDLPEYSAFQNYFLSSLDQNFRIVRDQIVMEPNTICLISDISSIESELRPDLFVALWSVSECPIKLRDGFKPVMERSKGLLIGFQSKFEQLDNEVYFKSNFNSSGESFVAIDHMPENKYIFK